MIGDSQGNSPTMTTQDSLQALQARREEQFKAPPATKVVPIPANADESTVAAASKRLLGGHLVHSARDLATRTGNDLESVREFCSSIGFPVRDDDALAFTQRDLGVFAAWRELVDSGEMTEDTSRSLLRANSHFADRLALWQIEALVEDAIATHGFDDTAARAYVLDHIADRVAIFERMLTHAWTRQLDALLARTEKEIAERGSSANPKARFPLNRSLGFVDMVSFTAHSALIGEAMVDLVQDFEDACRWTITEAGGRVVKMMGDAVLYIADDLATGLNVATSLIEHLNADDRILPVRASFVRGDVFSRSGDVFGPTVNLASRLVDIAPAGRILTDPATAAAIASGVGEREYRIEEFPRAELRGFGVISPYAVSLVQ